MKMDIKRKGLFMPIRNMHYITSTSLQHGSCNIKKVATDEEGM